MNASAESLIGVTIYPNPSSGQATIELGAVRTGTLVIKDISGTTMATQQFAKAQSLSTTIDQAGLYLMQLTFEDGTSTTIKHIVTE